MNITTKFSVGFRAYYVIFATASINPVDILKVWSEGSNILYKVNKTNTDIFLDRILEEELLTFSEAKVKLLDYLNEKIQAVSILVAP